MLLRKILLFIFFFAAVMVKTGLANNYYVDALKGNDTNSGKSTNLPFQTIQKAANTMVSGDTCFVYPGNYPERINVNTSGNQGSPIVFKALGAGVVTKGFTIIASYITVDGFEVTETSRTSWVEGAGFHIKGQYVKVLNNYIHITYREGIRLGDDPTSSATSNCLLQNNKIIRVGHSGILVCGVNNVVRGNEIAGVIQWAVTNPQNLDAVGLRFFGTGHIICNNYIHDIMLGDPENGNAPHVDAVQTWGPATFITIENNTFAMGEPTLNKQISMVTVVTAPVNDLTYRNNVCYNTLRGLNIYGSYAAGISTPIKNLKIENNTFDSFLDNPVELHDCPNAKVMNNIFYNTKELYIDDKTLSGGLQIGYNSYFHTDGTLPPGTHSAGDIWGTDPKFVDPIQRNYRLQETSLLIDKGAILSDIPGDLCGTPRPQGTGYDMGAYEYISTTTTTTGVASQKALGASPKGYQLYQNYPNPFNPSTVIKYTVPENSFVSLKVYDILGKEVATLVNEQKSQGSYEVQFDAGKLSSGMYIYQLKTDNFVEVKKMIVEK